EFPFPEMEEQAMPQILGNAEIVQVFGGFGGAFPGKGAFHPGGKTGPEVLEGQSEFVEAGRGGIGMRFSGAGRSRSVDQAEPSGFGREVGHRILYLLEFQNTIACVPEPGGAGQERGASKYRKTKGLALALRRLGCLRCVGRSQITRVKTGPGPEGSGPGCVREGFGSARVTKQARYPWPSTGLLEDPYLLFAGPVLGAFLGDDLLRHVEDAVQAGHQFALGSGM